MIGGPIEGQCMIRNLQQVFSKLKAKIIISIFFNPKNPLHRNSQNNFLIILIKQQTLRSLKDNLGT